MLAGIVTMTGSAIAQSDTITQNPLAKPFNKIWSIAGNAAGGDRVGAAISGLPDINDDGINEFGVYYATAAQWRIFYGAPNGTISHTPALILDSMGAVYGGPLATGNFWGDGRSTIVIPRGPGIQFLFFGIDTVGKELDTIPIVTLDPRLMTPQVYLSSIVAIMAADLDHDGADEFIIAPGGVSRGGIVPKSAEVWIYRGGPNFQVDSPTVILRDDSVRGGVRSITIGRWDHDDKLDIVLGLDYNDVQKIKFWFGTDSSPWNWTTPSRSVQFGGFVALDCDGDSLFDMAFKLPDWRVGLFLSSSGKSVLDRPFTLDDIDKQYHRYGFHNPVDLGYLSDSNRRFAMLGIVGANDGGPTTTLGFSGGPNGSDQAFDAYDLGGLFNITAPINDVTGDGWSDLLRSYPASGFNAGIAVLYAGGPYIPGDSTMGVELAEPVAGVRRDAVRIWPIPARDELHITWRGDLPAMPARFAIHDMLGRKVAQGGVESWRGEALWRCDGVPAGAYFLTVFDSEGALVATSRLLKQ